MDEMWKMWTISKTWKFNFFSEKNMQLVTGNPPPSIFKSTPSHVNPLSYLIIDNKK